MIQLSNLSYQIGGRTLYEDISLSIGPSDKIGLVGRNGEGKSTLFKIINGDLSPSSGTISRGKKTSIGFLNQDLLEYKSQKSILESALQAFGEALDLEKKIEETLKALESACSDALLEQLATQQERFEAMGGYTMRAKSAEMLERMGFESNELERPFNDFSGGWRMRVIFAKLLLEAPDLLLLDEPTNHLDMPAIAWVESYLKSYPKALMLISHDRDFLNAITQSTWAIAQKDIVRYSGNYDFYQKELLKRKEIQEKAYQNQQKNIKKQEEFIQRFRAKASKSALVQSRIKALEKIKRIDSPEESPSTMNVHFPMAKTSGKWVTKIEGISKAFPPLSLLKNASAHIKRGDKIALLGRNGKGKSTLLKIIAQKLPPDQGSVTLGHNVIIGHHTQHQLDELDPESTLVENLEKALPNATQGKIRSILGAFLFSGDAVEKKVGILSGGEKSRLSLAKIFALGPNFLLLDEPSNHLDMQSIERLIDALKAYKGTLLLIDHNRHIVKEVAKKIWYLKEGLIKEYPLGYESFLAEEKAWS